jgi:carboxyvinyl-carboxyphosphonate phosphorylmutase
MLIPLEEGVGKMRAALEARQDPALVIVGRTSAATLTGLADMIARCRAYEQAGVDAVFVTGLRKKGELEALRAEIRLPVLLGLVQGELVDRRELGEMGVRIALRGHQPFLAAVEAVRQTYAALREGAPPDRLPPRASPELMKLVTREPAYRRRMEELL